MRFQIKIEHWKLERVGQAVPDDMIHRCQTVDSQMFTLNISSIAKVENVLDLDHLLKNVRHSLTYLNWDKLKVALEILEKSNFVMTLHRH